MPASSFLEYARILRHAIDALVATGEAVQAKVDVDERSVLRGYIAGLVVFSDRSELHFREFVDLTKPEPRLMYAYHFQDAEKNLIFRYDNARHRPALSQPEHRHAPNEVSPSGSPTLRQVLGEILGWMG